MISQRRDVLAIVIGLLSTVVLALGIMIMVALPNLRHGSRILTPDGHRAVKRARQQAKRKPVAAAGSTWHGLVALERLIARSARGIARFWAPISVALHGQMDQLEARDAAKRNGSDPADPAVAASAERSPSVEAPLPVEAPVAVEAPVVPVPDEGPAPTVRQERFDVAKIIGRSSVGPPRSIPTDSGPIPEIKDDRQPRTATADSGARPGDRTIDLREPDRRESVRSDVDQGAGSARRAR